MLLHITILRIASDFLLGWVNINVFKDGSRGREIERDREREMEGNELICIV